MENEADVESYCFAWFARRAGGGENRAALLSKARWPPGAVIKVAFLDGDEELQRRVAGAAKLWTTRGLANLTLAFGGNVDRADIRISFSYKGSWSLIGTDCKTETDVSRPTMNLGWLRKWSSDIDVRAVALHEFGHALGLIHEHQSPAGGIQWNKERVYENLSGPPYYWDATTISTNMFEAFEANETNFTELDPKSIMMYPYPAAWTHDGFSTGRNTDLSANDRTLIHEMYP